MQTDKHRPPDRREENLSVPFDLYGFAVRMERLLRERGCRFTPGGFAVIEPEWCLREIPENWMVRPFSKASQTPDPSSTLLCPFEGDAELIGHLRKLPERIDVWKRYAGVCGFDLSPCADRTEDEQRFMLWTDGMVAGFLALNGIALVPNFRIGGPETLSVLDAMPRGVPYAAGTLGCARESSALGEALFRWKLTLLRPSFLLVYGSLQDRKKAILRAEGVPFRVVADYRSLCFAACRKVA